MHKPICLAIVFTLGLMASEADYGTQQTPADRAFNEPDSKGHTDKDLLLQQKDLEIERLKLELEKKELAEEKQKYRQSSSGIQPHTVTGLPSPKMKQDGFYVGIEMFRGSGTRSWKITDSDSSISTETEKNIEFSQQTLKVGMLVEGNRVYLGITTGKDVTIKGTSQYKDGGSIDFGFDLVFDSLYDPDASSNFLPFLRASTALGFYEYLKEDKADYEDDSATTVELRVGAGMNYQINRKLELAASFERLVSIQTFENPNNNTVTITDAVNGVALGINYHF